MKMWKSTGITGLAIIVVGITLPIAAHAETDNSGLFIGVGAGGVAPDLESIGLTEVGDAEGGGAAKLRVGYWLNKNWGVEANFLDHGTVSQKYTNGTFKATGQSYGIALLGRLPISDNWDFVGKLNLVHTQLKDDGSTGNQKAFKKFTGSSTNLAFPGLEIGYRFNPQMRLFVEGEYRGKAGDRSGVGYGGIGLEWKF